MKNRIRTVSGTLFAALLASALLLTAGCGQQETAQSETEEQAAVCYAVVRRLDRQSDVYIQLGDILKVYQTAQDRDVVQARFTGFCEGLACLARDNETMEGAFQQLFSGNPTLLETVRDLTGMTMKGELERLQLSALSEENLERLKELCYELETCCDRNIEGTLAYYISIRDFDSDSCQEAMKETRQRLMEWDLVTAF